MRLKRLKKVLAKKVLAKKVLAIVMAGLVLLSFGGCSLAGLDPDTLMHPPKPTGDKKDIYNLLEKRAGSGVTLKYPAAGEYRSAIIMYDITADGVSEAMAFYQKSGDAAGISLMFIQKQGGTWKEVNSFSNAATQVDRVAFGDINADGRDELIVGWGSSQTSSNNICVYSIQDGKITELDMMLSYSELVVDDFTGDGAEEILTAAVTVGDQPAVARLLRVRNHAIEIMGTAALDRSVTKYVSVSSGLLSPTQRGVVLDGSKSASGMVSEALYWDVKQKKLVAPFYDASTGIAYTYMERSTSVVSGDINEDKIIEIPLVTPLSGFSVAGNTVLDDTAYETRWMHYEEQNLTRVMSVVINYSGGYWFLLPDMWQGQVTTEVDVKERVLQFYEWIPSGENPEGYRGDELLRIQVFTQGEWSKQDSGEYVKLLDFNGLVYAASLPTPENKLAMNMDDVRNSFKLLKQTGKSSAG